MQEKIYESFISFGNMSREQQLEHIEILSSLLEKQQVMYTRLSLSDDPKAIEMRDNLRKSVSRMGFPPETDMLTLFSSMNATIKSLKDYIED
jgi:selenocysteine-specific translation elongation factor